MSATVQTTPSPASATAGVAAASEYALKLLNPSTGEASALSSAASVGIGGAVAAGGGGGVGVVTEQLPLISCCLCGVKIRSNSANMCVNCLQNHIDLSEHIPKAYALPQCPNCDRFESSTAHFIRAAWESRELLAVCLRKMSRLTRDVRLVDAGFIWTEPHSRRIRLKLTVQREVFAGAWFQQTFAVEFVITSSQCSDCEKSFTEHTWTALVQVRQKGVKHRKTLFYLEQLLLKSGAAAKAMSIKEEGGGLDFYFHTKSQASHLVEYLSSVVPVRVTQSVRVVSLDTVNNKTASKHTFGVDIAPICKGDLVCLPPKLAAQLGGVSPLLLCVRVTASLYLLDPQTLRTVEINAHVFFRNPFVALLSTGQLVEYTVLDVEREYNPEREGGSKSGAVSGTATPARGGKKPSAASVGARAAGAADRKSSAVGGFKPVVIAAPAPAPVAAPVRTAAKLVTGPTAVSADVEAAAKLADSSSSAAASASATPSAEHATPTPGSPRSVASAAATAGSSIATPATVVSGDATPTLSGAATSVIGPMFPPAGTVLALPAKELVARETSRQRHAAKLALVNATVARSSDLGVNDDTGVALTHLGNLLKAGDLVMGYDVAHTASLDDSDESLMRLLKGKKLPDIVLVKKSYANKKRKNKSRAFKLKHFAKVQNMSAGSGNIKRGKAARNAKAAGDAAGGGSGVFESKEYEEFLSELADDPEMRRNVNLFALDDPRLSGGAAGRAKPSSSAVASAAAAAIAAGGSNRAVAMTGAMRSLVKKKASAAAADAKRVAEANAHAKQLGVNDDADGKLEKTPDPSAANAADDDDAADAEPATPTPRGGDITDTESEAGDLARDAITADELIVDTADDAYAADSDPAVALPPSITVTPTVTAIGGSIVGSGASVVTAAPAATTAAAPTASASASAAAH